MRTFVKKSDHEMFTCSVFFISWGVFSEPSKICHIKPAKNCFVLMFWKSLIHFFCRLCQKARSDRHYIVISANFARFLLKISGLISICEGQNIRHSFDMTNMLFRFSVSFFFQKLFTLKNRKIIRFSEAKPSLTRVTSTTTVLFLFHLNGSN